MLITSCSVATGAKNASQVYFYGKVILIQSLLAASGIAKLFFVWEAKDTDMFCN